MPTKQKRGNKTSIPKNKKRSVEKNKKRSAEKNKKSSPKQLGLNTIKVKTLLNKLERAENVDQVMAVTQSINRLSKSEKADFRRLQAERIKRMKENLAAYTPEQRLLLFQAFWTKFS